MAGVYSYLNRSYTVIFRIKSEEHPKEFRRNSEYSAHVLPSDST